MSARRVRIVGESLLRQAAGVLRRVMFERYGGYGICRNDFLADADELLGEVVGEPGWFEASEKKFELWAAIKGEA